MSGGHWPLTTCTEIALRSHLHKDPPLSPSKSKSTCKRNGADAVLKRCPPTPPAVNILESEATAAKDIMVKLSGTVHVNGSKELIDRVDRYSDGFVYTKDFLELPTSSGRASPKRGATRRSWKRTISLP
jgi:hypothetical protein